MRTVIKILAHKERICQANKSPDFKTYWSHEGHTRRGLISAEQKSDDCWFAPVLKCLHMKKKRYVLFLVPLEPVDGALLSNSDIQSTGEVSLSPTWAPGSSSGTYVGILIIYYLGCIVEWGGSFNARKTKLFGHTLLKKFQLLSKF